MSATRSCKKRRGIETKVLVITEVSSRGAEIELQGACVGQLNEPLWVRVFVLAGVLAVAAFGAVGLVLADLGQFKPVLWIPIGAAAFAGLGLLARPLARPAGKVNEASNVGAIGAVVIALAGMIWNGLNAAKHAQINRDGVNYVAAGKWIAKHGTLEVHPFVGPFGRTGPFIASSTGMRARGGHLDFDLSHMLSALLAEAQNIGGDRWMFLTVPVLGGIALLVFYLLAARLLRHPFAALAATATLAFTMPQVAFSRDSTPEIPMQVLLFTAIWLLCDRRTLRRAGTGFCAGLLLGLVVALRGDGLVFLLGLPILFTVLWLRARHADRRLLTEGMIGCVEGIGVALLIAAFDLWDSSRDYLSSLQANLIRVAVLGAVIAFVAIRAVRLHRRRPDLVDDLRGRREQAAKVAFGLVLAFGFGAWFVRPLLQKTRGSANSTVAIVQHLDRLTVEPGRRYSELSVQWLSWYLGPLTLVLAIVGVAALAALFVRGSLRAPPATIALILAPAALLTIWWPSVTPDQVWAARRLLPAVFPGMILAAFALLCAVARDRDRPFLAERRFGVVVLAVAAVAVPLYTIGNVTQMTEQRGLFPVITDACRKIGPKGAVLMLAETGKPQSNAYRSVAQTLRSFCDVPVVVQLPRSNARAVQVLANQWRASGRRLVLVSEFPETILREFPKARVRPTLVGEELHMLEPTLTRRPSRYSTRRILTAAVPQLMIAPVPGTPRAPAPAG
jgi:hypothetical protein